MVCTPILHYFLISPTYLLLPSPKLKGNLFFLPEILRHFQFSKEINLSYSHFFLLQREYKYSTLYCPQIMQLLFTWQFFFTFANLLWHSYMHMHAHAHAHTHTHSYHKARNSTILHLKSSVIYPKPTFLCFPISFQTHSSVPGHLTGCLCFKLIP